MNFLCCFTSSKKNDSKRSELQSPISSKTFNFNINNTKKESSVELLKKSNFSVSKIVFENQYAKVTSIYDGDTLKLNIYFCSKLFNINCRLYGIDAPEIKKHNGIDDTDKALQSKKILASYVTNLSNDVIETIVTKKNTILQYHEKLVYIKFYGIDKYGRNLIEIFNNENEEKSINKLLVENNLVKIY